MRIAKTHLDFCSTAEHAIGQPRNEERFPAYWRHSRAVLNGSNQPGIFVTLLGYEWGLPGCGDMNVYFPGDGPEDVVAPRSFRELAAYVKAHGAIAVPHHTAYLGAPAGTCRDRYNPTGAEEDWRRFLQDYHPGADWARYTPEMMPVMEVFSMHGSSERDPGPFPMNLPWMAMRVSRGTLVSALEQGCKLGVIASSDGHSGYPGSYGAGLMAALVTELTREALWEAILKRRTYGVTGDRIKLSFSVNGRPMGSELSAGGERELLVEVEGEDALDRIDIVKNGRLWRRETRLMEPNVIDSRAKVRVEWGWGGADLTEWIGEMNVEAGRIVGCSPNFGPPPPNCVEEVSAARCRWVSHTIGVPPEEAQRRFFYRYAREGTNQIVVELEGAPDTAGAVRLNGQLLRFRLADLLQNSCAELVTGDSALGGRKIKLHQAVGDRRCTARCRFTDDQPERDEDSYYARVTQENGHTAWSSPIWVSQE